MYTSLKSIFLAMTLGALSQAAFADAPVIEAVTAQKSGDAWSFSVTLSHPDSGWEHYADGWEVLDAEGNSLGLRVLAHPHVNEQPFTRSLSGVEIPEGATQVFLRARCIVNGWNDAVFTLDLPLKE